MKCKNMLPPASSPIYFRIYETKHMKKVEVIRDNKRKHKPCKIDYPTIVFENAHFPFKHEFRFAAIQKKC